MIDVITAILSVVAADKANKRHSLMWRLDRLTPALRTLMKLPKVDKPSPYLLHGSIYSSIDTYLDAGIMLLDAYILAEDGLEYTEGGNQTLLTCFNLFSSSFNEINSCFLRLHELHEKQKNLIAKEYSYACIEWNRRLYQIYVDAYPKYIQLLDYLHKEITKQRNEIRMNLQLK